jgi:hypothetical protein
LPDVSQHTGDQVERDDDEDDDEKRGWHGAMVASALLN